MGPVACRDLLLDVTERTRALRGRIAALTGDLGAERLLWMPHRGWSIGQIVKHLLISDSMYHDRLRQALSQDRAEAIRDDGGPWRPSMPGRMLIGGLERNRRRLPAPAVFTPSPRPRPSVVSSYLSVLDERTALLEMAAGLDLRRVRLGSPVLPLFRVNAGDALLVLVAHGERHAAQIERVRAEAGFPSGET